MKRLYTRVFTFLLTLLLLGGTASEAWAVKYHILTKPFNVLNYNAQGNKWSNIRVEALVCESDESTVGLPEQFKSPLAKNFQYWASATSSYEKLYDSGHTGTFIISTYYYIYQCEAGNKYACLSDKLTEGASVGSYTDIYVTYDYINDGESSGYKNGKLELDGGTDYNIAFTKDNKEKFMCFNRSRNNRVANANGAALSGEQLASDDFVIPQEGSADSQLGWFYGKWGHHGIFAGFRFHGQDPYNITIMTSYEGKELYITDRVTTGNAEPKETIKPYAGITLMSKIGASSLWFDASNDRHYKLLSGTSTWSDEKYKECYDRYWNASEAERYDNWVGFYRYESPSMNSFALLPNLKNGGYMFVGSKMNHDKKTEQPSGGNYYIYFDNYDTDGGKKRSQPYFKLQSLNSAYPTNIFEIRTYTVHVKTHGATGETPTTLTATMKWSDARLSDDPAEHFPEALRRKYCSYTAYSDAACTIPANSFQAIQDANNGRNIYLKYTVSESMPFETLPAGGSYEDARWYTMRMDGVANPKYIAYEGTLNSLVVTNGSGAAKGSNTDSQVHQGENSAEAMVAFMGDPYELKILNRKACETATPDNKFIGCPAASAVETNLTTTNNTSDITTWEIVYESTGVDDFVLRKFKTANEAEGGEEKPTPKYIGLGSDANNKPVTYSTTSTRIKVVELEKVKYTYHIVRNKAGDIAVKASDTHDIAKKLKSWTDIPEIIRSPFLNSATVTYYGTIDDAKNQANAITNAPYGSERDIYVRYSVSISGGTYNVRLNNDYIYTNEDNINSKPNITTDEAAASAFQWTLDYSDPYHMTIKNKDKFVNVAFNDKATISWSGDTKSYFVAKSGASPGTYEVMAATGEGTDASDVYYNIGRPTENTVKLYSKASYLSGNAFLRFQLIATTATDVVYHLIDKAGKDLLQASTRQPSTEAPAFPPQYHSPLVSSYHYYVLSDFDYNSTTDTYTLKTQTPTEAASVSSGNIYVTYDVNDLINLKSGQLYLLEYEAGETFNQEDGSDGVNPTAQKAVYPYVNGDGNFFVYGKEQYELQQEGAASTRTRWAWYVQSNIGGTKGDPYHVTIRSRQSESYPITNSSEYNAYFMTYKPDDYDKVVTTLAWPGMSSETATEYMVLGSEGQYQLVTSYPINGSRYVVNSFEQYWKTWDTIRKKVLGDSGAKENDSDPITVPETSDHTTPSNNRTYLADEKGWHSYAKWAYAKRWNGYNNGYSSAVGAHEKKKGWETIEHWFQTVDMGQGYFDFVKTSIDPVLILLDQHGWEIMRKPLPNSPDDPEKEAKYAAIRPYNSPMVKEYAFWATAKKRTGLHQYYLLSDRVGGENFTSTDLTKLPPYGSANVLDKKGNLNDQYVTYIVKDEFAQTYQPGETPTAKPFLIEQGTDHKYATTNGSTISASDIPQGGDMKAHILNDNIPDTEKWYVKPNATIDNENGYNDVSHNWDAKTPNAYEDNSYSGLKTAVYIKETDEYKTADAAGKKALTDKFGQFSFSNGFDPYNIQIKSVSASKYMKTNASGATLEEGSMIGTYSDSPAISLGDNTTIISPKPRWYDSRNLDVTNATFMAVQDADGNMQLMPRFDHALRMSEFGTLIPPTDDNVSKTYTKLYRPEVYEYLIIDNDGHESLRYKTGGDLTPQIPDHFQSPLATNFTYYATATESAGVYSNLTDEIEESLDGVTLTGNKIYVRYEYDDEADDLNMLKGNWLTMQLNEKDAIEGIKQGTSKPSTIDGNAKTWQWKFLESPQSKPDPYAIYIYNRSQTAGTEAISDRFALLSHSAGDYALAKAGRGDYTYQFLNGSGMTESVAAVVGTEAGFTPTSGTFDGTKSQVKLTDEVAHTFKYKVYTNGGVNAIDANQLQEDVLSNDWKPVLPEAARTPLLNMDQYLYYEQSLVGSVAKNDTLGTSLSTLYGLYDDIVYTHYTPYDPDISTYLVPNVRNATSETIVARGVGSNDATIGLNGTRPYNIIWYNDKMMKANVNTIGYTENNPLSSTVDYEWVFEGDDPYAIKIRNKSQVHGEYVHEASSTTTNLDDDPTTFMLLNRDSYEYGVFAKTENKDVMLSGYGNTLVTDDHNVGTTTDNPTKFIIFALSTNKVIYHLMIKNIGEEVRIPYRDPKTGVLDENHKIKDGTTLRDLKTRNTTGGIETHIDGDQYQLGVSLTTIDGIDHSSEGALGKREITYCYDAGHVSLGDALEVPHVFYRPNVSYDYYIEGVYASDGTAGIGTAATEVTEMNTKYKGLKVERLGEENALLDKTIFVNIVYNFMGGLDTNSGSDFVESVTQNKWYTFETNDATPMLAEYTGSLQTKSGYATHYTNDYLWTPVGDPYGFKMYNRYLYKNLRQNKVMSTSAFTTGTDITMVDDNVETVHLPANSVYELLATSTTTSGYFHIHPVVNKEGTQVYMRNYGDNTLKLNSTPTEWTFGLSEDVMRPYYLAAGYVGGLNAKGKAAYEAAVAETDPSKMLKKLMDLQDVVYNHDNIAGGDDNYIVHYTPGYYRLHNQPGSSDISTPRYASGYTHMIEKDVNKDGNEADAIPMHFYEVEDYGTSAPVFTDLGTAGTDYSNSAATRGDLPLQTVTNDPASIFYFYQGTAANPTTKIQTQGLFVKENKMTATESSATSFEIIDIGAGVVALQGGDKFLKYAQNDKKYDLKFDNTASTIESTRWCMKPVQKSATAGEGEMELRVKTNNGGDNYYYTTFCAPFDVLMTNERDVAYVIPPGEWPSTTTPGNLYPKEIGEYTSADNNQFIPARTPVIIRTSNPIGYVTMALPNSNPSPSPVSCLFTGKYLEQMLDQGADDVYVFGRDLGTYKKAGDYSTTGQFTTVSPSPSTGIGFYINANPNREASENKASWTRNNKYVYANKIYYRAGSSGAGTRGVEFVPVVFEAAATDVQGVKDYSEGMLRPGNVYNLQGRCVATEEMVKDGTWKNNLTPGVYIMNGKKIIVR